ncbi:MAG: hypothetical protein ACRESZ_16785 [Methylococcales bacterium]
MPLTLQNKSARATAAAAKLFQKMIGNFKGRFPKMKVFCSRGLPKFEEIGDQIERRDSTDSL